MCGILGTGGDTCCTDHQVEATWGRSDLRAGSGRGAGRGCGLGKGGAPGSGDRGERSRQITGHKKYQWFGPFRPLYSLCSSEVLSDLHISSLDWLFRPRNLGFCLTGQAYPAAPGICPLAGLNVTDRAWRLFPRTLPAGPALPQEGPRTLWDLWPGFLAALCLSWLLVCLGELGGPWGSHSPVPASYG